MSPLPYAKCVDGDPARAIAWIDDSGTARELLVNAGLKPTHNLFHLSYRQ